MASRPKTVRCRKGSKVVDVPIDVACSNILLYAKIEVWYCLLSIINDTTTWQHFLSVYPKEIPILKGIMEIGEIACMLEKVIKSKEIVAAIRERIQLWAPTYLAELYLSIKTTPDSELNDFQFAMRMSAQRDIHSYYPICVEDDIGIPERNVKDRLATQETIMFRPCGHTVCLDPCLSMLQIEAGINPLTPEMILAAKNNFKHTDVTQWMHAMTTDGGFDCPMCRVAVIHTFMVWDPKIIVSKTINKFIREVATSVCPRLFP